MTMPKSFVRPIHSLGVACFMDKNNNSLFYTCSLIEFISRQTRNNRKDVVEYLGDDLERIYNYEDVFHCEPIEKVADDFITRNNIPDGEFDNIVGLPMKLVLDILKKAIEI